MSNAIEAYWKKKLEYRIEASTYRTLRLNDGTLDFYSNDYLGMARNNSFQKLLYSEITKSKDCLTGSTGSRLLSGNSKTIGEVEAFIASQHNVEASLLFPSGYKANLALFSCLLSRHDTVIADEYIHRSIIDGCVLSNVNRLKFKHNDIDHLEKLLKKTKGNCVVVVESLYSMEGDLAPLHQIIALSKKYHAEVVVDEAHALGVYNKGLIDTYKLQNQVLATVVTYGKAFGVQGAAILGSQLLKEYLVNFAAPFIFSTSMSDYQVLSVKKAYEFVIQNSYLQKQLLDNVAYFNKNNIPTLSEKSSPIKAIIINQQHKMELLLADLKKEKLLCLPILAPTVKKGTERLRICIHAFNTNEEMNLIIKTINKHL